MGDRKYGLPDSANLYNMSRLALHAYQLKMKHPYTGKEMILEVPLPLSFRKFIEAEENKK
jgi:23S rRNA-/tRNA-specific pseudouridylate synthase